MDAAGRIKLWSKQLKTTEIRRFERPKLVETCLKVPTLDCEKETPKDLLIVVLSSRDWKYWKDNGDKKYHVLTFCALWANLPLIIVHDELWARYFWAKLSVVTPAHFCSPWLALVLSLANYITITLALFGSLWLTLTHFASLQLTRSLLGCLNQNFETHFWHSQFHQH